MNVDALSKNLVNTIKQDEDFGCDVMEHETKAKFASPHFGDNPHNEAIINLFALQLVDEETTNEELHQLGDEEQSVHYSSKKKLQHMNHEDYQRMVVEAQIMVDWAKQKQKGKCLGIIELCEMNN